ncbi:MAG: MBL fold metallo-hydrolase [Candidatus Marinimicrobia bacterium]|jgi:7,8-dihydropterin-6-yl-methyl-4-(beta-D-ribofuranosyl)aminobenzene 5'-phosphate synthase|nr:MBL fold metallo-hydrolase [Candidatus Neomarinimicrobiota bacterium]MDX9777248.1 MBL fold metallo-hydrolase [bacterium]
MESLEILILYDNSSADPNIRADWGFSALIRTGARNILFDTGADATILLANMKYLNVPASTINTIFISHHHFDHTGALSTFLHAQPHAEIFIPQSLRGLRRPEHIFHIDGEYNIDEDIYSTGELKGIEQSLFIQTPAGFVLIAGCSHPGLEYILPVVEKHGHIHALIGGLHGFNDYRLLADIDYVCPTHCTRHIAEIAGRYPDKYLPGGAGRQYRFPNKK